jgi:hypothetical protein
MKDNFETRVLALAIVLAIVTMLYIEVSNPCAAWNDALCEYAGGRQ